MLLKKVIFKNGLRYKLDIDEVKKGDKRMFIPFPGKFNLVRISNRDNVYINTKNCHTYFGD